MLKEFVYTTTPHKHPIRGDVDMDVKKTIIGNTTLYVYSPLANMSSEEKRNWFESEKAKGNRILQEISDAINACYED